MYQNAIISLRHLRLRNQLTGLVFPVQRLKFDQKFVLISASIEEKMCGMIRDHFKGQDFDRYRF